MSNYEPIIEQNNTELQSNNTDLQGLLDTINALPVAENLDTVLAQQETLIADIKTTLEGKAGEISAYVDEDGYLCLSAGSVVNNILEV